MRIGFFRLILFLGMMSLPFAALAENRLALVFGNDRYDEVDDLQKARADASAVADSLKAQGYGVTTVLDASRRQMNMRISQFASQLAPGDTAMVFYAGHGVEIDGENYLLPTDIAAPASGEEDFVKSESIALSALLDRIRATGARTTVAIIDACRDNPFRASNGRSVGGSRGLGRITAPEGTFVIFSAGAGQTALDRLSDTDPAENSVFTRMLLPQLQKPGTELRDMMSALRRDVRDLARTVGHDQFPAYYDELVGAFYFNASSATSSATGQGGVASVTAPDFAGAGSGPAVDAIRADFDLARSLDTREAYATFIQRYASRRDEFTVQMAMKLHDAFLNPASPAEADPETRAQSGPAPDADAALGGGAVVSDPAPAPAPDTPLTRRDVLRQTQARLNALGCNAGSPDGINGPRTRDAYRRFLSDSGADLTPETLGTPAGLAAVLARSGTVCAPVTASAGTGTSGTSGTSGTPSSEAPARTEVDTPVYRLTGTWNWSASCPLGIKASGSTVFRSTGGNRYRGAVSGTAGTGTVYATLKGRSYAATEDFGWIKNTASGTLSKDGRSMSIRVSNGCRVTARKN